MAVKHEKVPGASPGYGSMRPVLTCDGPKCKKRVVGNAGQGDETLKERAMSLGYRQSIHTGKHFCPTCGHKVGAKA